MPAENMPSEECWYIVKQSSEECKIISGQAFEEAFEASKQTQSSLSAGSEPPSESEQLMHWGPFETQNQAIAKRVGLIRAGKCQPAS
ncbi:MAG: DDE transposase family protein [Cyanobacteria bacterium P01_D01_bin.1]